MLACVYSGGTDHTTAGKNRVASFLHPTATSLPPSPPCYSFFRGGNKTREGGGDIPLPLFYIKQVEDHESVEVQFCHKRKRKSEGKVK